MAQMTEQQKATVNPLIEKIKTSMPHVHRAVQAKAAEIGNEAYTLVRRGLLGEPDCFYAFESGHVVGTPFKASGIMSDVAAMMVQFGCAHVCIFPLPTEAVHGSH